MATDPYREFARITREAIGDGTEQIRWYAMCNALREGPIRLVLVVTEDVDLRDRDEALIVDFARLATEAIKRDRRIAACAGHEWEFGFDADYLDGERDAICRCGARRSEVGV